MAQFICTHCGWAGADPSWWTPDAPLCPRCPYLVLRLPEAENPAVTGTST